jgi:hypothetical protein
MQTHNGGIMATQTVLNSNLVKPKKHVPTWVLVSMGMIVLIGLLVLNGQFNARPTVTSVLPPLAAPLVYDATGAMLNAVVYPHYPEQRIYAHIEQYDATGAMQNAIVYAHQVRPISKALAYDATGAMQNAIVYAHQVQPVSRPLAYDATATMLNSIVLSNQVRPVSRPLPYDATGAMLEAVVFPKYPE